MALLWVFARNATIDSCLRFLSLLSECNKREWWHCSDVSAECNKVGGNRCLNGRQSLVFRISSRSVVLWQFVAMQAWGLLFWLLLWHFVHLYWYTVQLVSRDRSGYVDTSACFGLSGKKASMNSRCSVPALCESIVLLLCSSDARAICSSEFFQRGSCLWVSQSH